MELLVVILGAGIGLTLFVGWLGRWLASWGATPEEVASSWRSDAWLGGGPQPRVCMTRAIWIDASPEDVWSWVAQTGRGAGWYSYDWIDNWGRRSARRIVSWIPEPRIGDASVIGYVRHVEAGRELAWWLGIVRGWGLEFRNVMHYRISRVEERTRLLVRVHADAAGGWARPACWAYRTLDGIMCRRQLLGIRACAEARRPLDPQVTETGEPGQYQKYQVLFADGRSAGEPGRTDAVGWRAAAIQDGVLREPPLRREDSPDAPREPAADD